MFQKFWDGIAPQIRPNWDVDYSPEAQWPRPKVIDKYSS